MPAPAGWPRLRAYVADDRIRVGPAGVWGGAPVSAGVRGRSSLSWMPTAAVG
ncbi:hypothetical protein [Streptomyces sp. PRh5]|uniref:hypothetical protein n=1 Tax=Streptomyces sp. PRh5 TaxID=1158056 RepID=UPI0004B530EA|nr:hypothetical protein [Streptomyces sp. PRh5]